MKQIIRAARISVMTTGMEFVRVVYGTPSTMLMIIITYVCRECGHCPKYDYDWVLSKCNKESGWYCARFLKKDDKLRM